MAKWFGKIGYSDEQIEIAPGVWTPEIVVREYYGDVVRNSTKWNTNTESTNDDLTVSCQISIVADPFAIAKFHSMKWIEFMGVKWKITNVEPQFPRLLLNLGGEFNG